MLYNIYLVLQDLLGDKLEEMCMPNLHDQGGFGPSRMI